MKITISGWNDANTAALATLVLLTAVYQVKKCPNRKAPDKKARSRFFFETAKSFLRLSSLAKIGTAKKGSAISNLQNPVTEAGAEISAPKLPEVAPHRTATTTKIFA